jgi:hypothetical protein
MALPEPCLGHGLTSVVHSVSRLPKTPRTSPPPPWRAPSVAAPLPCLRLLLRGRLLPDVTSLWAAGRCPSLSARRTRSRSVQPCDFFRGRNRAACPETHEAWSRRPVGHGRVQLMGAPTCRATGRASPHDLAANDAGLSEAARFFGVTARASPLGGGERCCRKRARDFRLAEMGPSMAPPNPVAVCLRLMLASKITLDGGATVFVRPI